MSSLGQDFVSHMSAFCADFEGQGPRYKTIWSKVRGPVAKRRRYKDDLILIDMYMEGMLSVDESNKQVGFMTDVAVGSDAWSAALESKDDLVMDLIRIGELGVFQFTTDYHPSLPQHMVEEQMLRYLELLERKPEWHANDVWHEMFMDVYKQYEFYREQELRNSIFFYYWSRDCDLCESEGVQVFRNWFEAAEWIHGFGESAEGPQHLEQVTYEYWQTFNPVPKRDRALEQFEENGYGF